MTQTNPYIQLETQTFMGINTICIIEDNQTDQFIIEYLIKHNNLARNILTFPNGKEAHLYLWQHRQKAHKLPDVVLLDLNMPLMDGWAFMDDYLKIKNDLVLLPRIYVASSSIAKMDIRKADNYPDILGYLIKPILKPQLMEILSNLSNS